MRILRSVPSPMRQVSVVDALKTRTSSVAPGVPPIRSANPQNTVVNADGNDFDHRLGVPPAAEPAVNLEPCPLMRPVMSDRLFCEPEPAPPVCAHPFVAKRPVVPM